MKTPDSEDFFKIGVLKRFAASIASFIIALPIYIAAAPAHADYIPFNGAEVAPNIAEIRVDREGVSIQLEVFVDDISAFEALVPDDWFQGNTANRPTQTERLADFEKIGLSVQREDGRVLPVAVRTLEPRMRVDRTNALSGHIDPLTGRSFPKPPDDPRVLYVELFYDYEGERPEALTFVPPMADADFPSATIGMLVFDREVPVINFRYLSGPATLSMDWNDPWYSRFDAPNLTRHHQSSVTTYVYIEPREVRHETLFRLRDLDPWLSLGLASGDVLAPETQARLKKQAAEILITRNPVEIDGLSVIPEEVRTELLRLDPSGMQVLEGDQRVGADAVFVGVILSFPVEDIPQSVDVTWDMFDDRIIKVPAILTDEAGPFISGALPDDPTITWTNHLLTYENPQVNPVKAAKALAVPLLTVFAFGAALLAGFLALRTTGRSRWANVSVAVVALGTGALVTDVAVKDIRNPLTTTPDQKTAVEALGGLLSNVSIAHLETSHERRTKQLRPLITEASLENVSSELDRSLAIRVPGGGLARVREVSEVSLQNIEAPTDGFGFQALAEWTATASAEHWGHRHDRTLHYRALVEIVEKGGLWKLYGITVLETRSPNT